MSVTSSAVRRHHTDLQPLAIRPGTPITLDRRKSSQGSGSSIKSTTPFPSPSIVAARAYFGELSTPIGFNADALQRRRSLFEGQSFPRRHSVLSTGNLTSQLESFSFSPRGRELPTVPETDEHGPNVKIEASDDLDMLEVETKSENQSARRKSELLYGTPQDVFRQVPFQYTHEHLRDWGYVYLGNSATADAFVNVVSLRRPSLALVKEDEFQVKTSDLVTIRARINPKAKERKPFLIQRQFNIEELRASIPAIQTPGTGTTASSPTKLRRSTRIRRSSTQQMTPDFQRRGSADRTKQAGEKLSLLGKGSIPIHIEYALHYLPVLAALMLSGHVRKGDSIDLPIPHPESWQDVINFIYTGNGAVTSGMRANILFLAGHA